MRPDKTTVRTGRKRWPVLRKSLNKETGQRDKYIIHVVYGAYVPQDCFSMNKCKSKKAKKTAVLCSTAQNIEKGKNK